MGQNRKSISENLKLKNMKTETKQNTLIVIKRDGEYFNAQHKRFSPKLHLASWYKNKKEAHRVAITFGILENYEVCEILEDEFYAAGSDCTTRTIIACEIARTHIENSLDIIPAVTMDAKHLRNALGNAINKLKVIAPHIEDIQEEKENEAYMCLGIHDAYVREVTSIDIVEMEEITRNIQAWKKDRKSINGITNKILRNE